MVEETGEPACMLGEVCPECGRVLSDEDAPACEACGVDSRRPADR